MDVLTPEQMIAVVGGKSETIGPGSYHYEQTGFETCVGVMDRRGAEKYPDNRWFFQRWLGADDPNAGPRADWTRDAIRDACKPAK